MDFKIIKVIKCKNIFVVILFAKEYCYKRIQQRNSAVVNLINVIFIIIMYVKIYIFLLTWQFEIAV